MIHVTYSTTTYTEEDCVDINTTIAQFCRSHNLRVTDGIYLDTTLLSEEDKQKSFKDHGIMNDCVLSLVKNTNNACID